MMKIEETSMAIKKIIDIKDVEILKDAKCFNALFGDLAPDLMTEKRVFQRAINDDVLFSFYAMYSMPDVERRNEILKADKYLREAMGFSDEWSYYIISSFAKAFDWDNPLSEKKETSQINKSENIDNIDLSRICRDVSRKIAVGSSYVLAIDENSTVIAVGDNRTGQCEVSAWHDIVEVDADAFHSVGLKRDGTVITTQLRGPMAQKINYGQCNVSTWKNIISVSAGVFHTVGLCSDGTVVATGDNRKGSCNVSDWKDIIAISAGGVLTVGLKKDGTVVATGGNDFGQCNINSWEEIVSVAVSGTQVMGLKKDGTVLTTHCSGDRDHGQCNVSRWTDIIAISTSAYNTIGLKKDGTVISTDYIGESKYQYGQTDIANWSGIIAVCAAGSFSVGLKKDGTFEMSGNNQHGQKNVMQWKLFSDVESYIKNKVEISNESTKSSSHEHNANNKENAILIELRNKAQNLRKEKSSLGFLSVKRKKEIDEELYEIESKVKNIITDHSFMDDKSFAMPVADVFAITGRGTVITGTIEKGNIKNGDTVSINSQNGIVAAIECNRKIINTADRSSGTIGILVKNINKEDVNIGDILYK